MPEIDDAFGNWAAGFADAEGSFYIRRETIDGYRPAFSMSLRVDDRPVLERCAREIAGRVNTYGYNGPYNSPGVATWSCDSKSDINKIVDFFNYYILRGKKALDFNVWKLAVPAYVEFGHRAACLKQHSDSIKKYRDFSYNSYEASIKSMDNASFGSWFSGFSDGDGSFYITIRRDRKYLYYRPIFSVKARKDNESVIHQCCDRFGFGSLRNAPSYKNSKPTITWVCSAKNDLRKIIDLFDEFPLRSKKIRDYEIWREAIIEGNDKSDFYVNRIHKARLEGLNLS